MKVDIRVGVKMPDKNDDRYRPPSLCDKCREFMEVCESDIDSQYHFDYLKAVYKKLANMPNKPEKLKQLTLDLEQFMMKHGSVDSSPDNQVDLDHRTMEIFK